MILRLFNSLISNGDFQNPTQTSLETDLINVSFAQENLQSKTTQKKEILLLSKLFGKMHRRYFRNIFAQLFSFISEEIVDLLQAHDNPK